MDEGQKRMTDAAEALLSDLEVQAYLRRDFRAESERARAAVIAAGAKLHPRIAALKKDGK